MRTSRSAAWLCFVAAVAFVVASGLSTYEVFQPAIRWNAVDASVDSTQVGYRHDGNGILVFYVAARLRYTAAGQQIATDASSDYSSYDFSEIQKLAKSLPSSSPVRAYWNPSNPNQARFLLDYGGMIRPDRAGAAVLAVLLVLGGMSLRNRAPDGKCARCGMPSKAFYRYCPHCKSPVQTITAVDQKA